MSCDTSECSEPEWLTGPVQSLPEDQGRLGEEIGGGRTRVEDYCSVLLILLEITQLPVARCIRSQQVYRGGM